MTQPSQSVPAFAGRIPETYDRYMGPIFFDPYARDLASRVQALAPARVLELACGTGIVTRRLRDALPADARLVATDLNPPMMTWAASKFGADERVEWRQADATMLPFGDGSFDAVVCQFGVMFFPDKLAAFREAHRVLAPGGTLLFTVWDSLDRNELSQAAIGAMAALFPANPPAFYHIVFGFHDRARIAALLADAGFGSIELATSVKPADAASAHDAGVGLVQGTPMATLLAERGEDLSRVVDAVAQAIRDRFGDHPVRTTMTAIVCSARRE